MVHFYSETTWADYYTWPLTMKISPIANKISQSILLHFYNFMVTDFFNKRPSLKQNFKLHPIWLN